jgi:2-keto-4-pentenoate hydratase/2-oxohepta-3-ene-1,7-dioic acid hydratase in catechol pathway
MQTRRHFVAGAAAGSLAAQPQGGGRHYVRFLKGRQAGFGLLEGEIIRELSGALFGAHKPSGAQHKLAEVKLLIPVEPPKILAVGLNYKSHIGDRPAPANPEMFYKPITALRNPGESIIIPSGATDVHYEGELVVVIGKRASNVTTEQARDVIFGVTCGNDVSERQWQNGPKKDLQWWRAKGADTFAPLGPSIARGLDYGNLLLQTRLNGKVVQKQTTADLLFNCEEIISFVSRYVALTPGDVIYTGTPGRTEKMKPGDVVEVDIQGIGVLKNPVAAASV